MNTLKQILPVYLTMHALFVLLTVFTPLFTLADFSTNSLPLHTLIDQWDRWDTGHYKDIAIHGYDGAWRTAFFPLFPLFEKIGAIFLHKPFTAGLVVSNIANLGVLMVLYELVKEDFGEERASRSVLYLSIFPSAFFLVSAYTESLFLFLVLLSFYQIRRGNFWIAGVFALMAGLTRSTGIFLLFPMVYELSRKRQVRFDLLSVALVPAGLIAYSAYCQWKFGDLLAWEHAQSVWHHQLMPPWQTLWTAIKAIKHSPGILSFQALHNLLDLTQIFFTLAMTTLALRRLPGVYIVYAVPILLFLLSVPIIGDHPVPLQSVPRFILEVFPSFIIAGNLGKHRWFHDGYLLLSGSLLFVSCMLFLVGHWMV